MLKIDGFYEEKIYKIFTLVSFDCNLVNLFVEVYFLIIVVYARVSF